MQIEIINQQEVYQKFIQKLQETDVVEVFPEVLEHIESQMKFGIFFKNGFELTNGLKWHNSWLQEIKAKYPDIHIFDSDVEKRLMVQSFEFEYDNHKTYFSECDDDTLNQTMYLIAMIPPSEKVFEKFIDGSFSAKHNEWILEYFDKYDDIFYEMMPKQYYIQLGGYGAFIQYDVDSYIGQVNAEIGDAGSVYVYVDDSELKTEVQMY